MPHKSPYPNVPIPERTVHDFVLEALEKNIREKKNEIAFIDSSNNYAPYTNETLKSEAYTVGSYLYSIGFKKDVAATYLPNTVHYAAFFLGVAMNGGAISGASALFTDFELHKQLVDSNAKVVLTNHVSLPRLLLAIKDTKVAKIIVVGQNRENALPEIAVSWDQVMQTPIVDIPKPKIDVRRDVIFLPFSSGTTGSPKGVMQTHYNFMAMIASYYTLEEASFKGGFDGWDWTKENACLYLPIYHNYGFNMMLRCVIRNMTGVLIHQFDLKLFLKVLQDYKVRVLPMAPPIVVMLSKSPLCDEFNITSLHAVFVAAAPIGKDLIEKLMKRHPNIKYVQQGYGMTECTLASHLPDLRVKVPIGSVGRLAPNYSMMIVNPDTWIELPDGQQGEICLGGPTVMLGYLSKPKETAAIVRNGWLHTGDIGYVDADGFLYIVDRMKELIKVRGLQVAPSELEDVLLSNPRIRDCAVVGVPHELLGEVPKAYVVKADRMLTENEVKEFVKVKVAEFKYLEGGVEFIDQIPKSAAGKILRRVLRDRNNNK
ncbi:unnamed protein product [Caenorhabditis bovis]|uniref:Uncharacterized protein n=1 Tax=Caenorhabditis bovis TaxID=2654633 RepID=A0A8S1E5B0_9PELO|nr:unnamed protein product [Caenorhabditis bovis]